MSDRAASNSRSRSRDSRDSRASQRSLSQQISAIGARIVGAMSPSAEREGRKPESDNFSVSSTMVDVPAKSRSISRGREAFHSSGRGGVGNIRPSTSVSRDSPRTIDGPDDFSITRGREPAHSPSPGRAYSTGRGGAGNIRSPSRSAVEHGRIPEEEELIRQHIEDEKDAPRSFGRGGVGNISTPRSPSRGSTTNMHSTGRGGAGNIRAGTAADVLTKDELERKHAATNASSGTGVHSTGRGGSANMTPLPPAAVEKCVPQHTVIRSSGRGGAGNMIRHTSVEV